MKIETINKISAYLAIVESISDDVRRSNSDELLLFRGQNVDEPLLPKIAREYETIRDYGNPYLYDPFTIETMMLEDFKRRSRPYLTKEPSSDLDWLMIAQHHGMNTRLLDWTENPLVSLFFALQPIIKSTDRVVWILRIGKKEVIAPNRKTNPFNFSQTRLFMPNIVSPRLVTQAGWFTIHKHNKKKDKFIALEKNTVYKKLLTKVVINSNYENVVDLMKQLDLCGVNSSSLFVDLDGLCKHINIKKVLHNRYHIRMPEAKKKI